MITGIRRWIAGRGLRWRPRIGSLATMPTRAESFARALPAIAPQVDRLFVYLDGFAEVPDILRAYGNVIPLLAHEHGSLHQSGRFLPLTMLREPCVFVVFDDDIQYPANYVSEIAGGLAACGGRAVVGYHANVFVPPYRSYVKDRRCHHFASGVALRQRAHTVGCGTSAFDSAQLRFDPRTWPRSSPNDLMLAIEAERRGLPRIVLPRAAGWLEPIAELQPDSVFAGALRDERAQSRLLATLIGLMGESAGEIAPAPSSAA